MVRSQVWSQFEAYAEQTVANARALADQFEARGLGPASGGTDTHLVDLRPSHPDTTGEEVESALERAGIVLNATTVPGETRSAFGPSGIRAGTPRSRGFTESACREVADRIVDVVDAPDDREVGERVDELTDEYTLYE